MQKSGQIQEKKGFVRLATEWVSAITRRGTFPPGVGLSVGQWKMWRRLLGCAILVLLSGLIFRNLGHENMTAYDEVFHAVVAKNMTRHPLTPTLYDRPILDYNPLNWAQNHVWYHKPPLAMWTIAASFSALGFSTFALRLPSALLAIGSLVLTYLIGREVWNRRCGAMAAALQGINPFLMELVHGYRFSDNIDVALLFWCETAAFALLRALKSARYGWFALAGAASGAAYLVKSFQGLLFLGVGLALAAWSGWTCADSSRRWRALRGVAVQWIVCLAVCLPWHVYSLRTHPNEYRESIAQFLGHLGDGIAGWSGAWDRHLFYHLPLMLPGIVLAAFVAVVFVIWRAWRNPRVGEKLLALWILGTLIPFSLAVSKTPSAIVMVLPAILLCLARWVDAMLRAPAPFRLRMQVALWTGVWMFFPGLGMDHQASTSAGRWVLSVVASVQPIAPTLAANAWLAAQALGMGLVWLALWLYGRMIPGGNRRWASVLGAVAVLYGITSFVALSGVSLLHTWAVTQRDRGPGAWRGFGAQLTAATPERAAILWDDCPGLDFLHLMFLSDRSVYPLSAPCGNFSPIEQQGNPYNRSLTALVEECRSKNARAYLITPSVLELPEILKTELGGGFHVYDITALTQEQYLSKAFEAIRSRRTRRDSI